MSVGNHDDALDLVQDAMFGFVRSYANRPENEWGVLFQRVLQSRITDWYRRSTVRGRIFAWFGGSGDDEDQRDPVTDAPDPRRDSPADLLLRREQGESLESAIAALPLRQRQAFLLRAWEGLDTAETAKAMGCSEGSVKTHYSRAVHALRELLEEMR